MKRLWVALVAMAIMAALGVGCGDDDPVDPAGTGDVGGEPDATSDEGGEDDVPAPEDAQAEVEPDEGPDSAPDSEDAAPDTPEVEDAGPDLPTTAPEAVIISELMVNPDRVEDANGEWIELYNGTAADVDLSGWTLRDDGAESHVITTDEPLVIAAGAYLVLGASADPNLNGGVAVDYVWSDFSLSNSADEVVLEDAAQAEIARVAYDTGAGWTVWAGVASGLAALGADPTLPGSWCLAAAAWDGSDGDRGTPGAQNTCGPAPEPPDDGCPESPVKTLAFDQGLCEAIGNGSRTIALRPKHSQWIAVDDWVRLVCSGDQTVHQAQVTQARLTTWGEITLDEYQAAGYASQQDMMDDKSEDYPGITLESPATVFRWTTISKCTK